jgi:hypothetical protein
MRAASQSPRDPRPQIVEELGQPRHAASAPQLSKVGQVAQHPAQGHFRISGLEAALHRCSDPALRLGVEHALAEEIGVAPEVLGRRERDPIDPILDRAVAGGREPGDPMSERSDELAELVGGQRSIDPFSEPTLRSDPASSPGVYATASAEAVMSGLGAGAGATTGSLVASSGARGEGPG